MKTMLKAVAVCAAMVAAFLFTSCGEHPYLVIQNNVVVRVKNSEIVPVKVEIPKGVTKIAKGAFEGCYEIESVKIPKGVTEIGENAFRNCHHLNNITIPTSVTKIGNFAFYNSTSNVEYAGTKAQWGMISMNREYLTFKRNTTVHCRDGAIDWASQ